MKIIWIHNIIVADESIKKMHSCILSVLFFNRSNIKRTGTDSCSIYSSEIMSSGKNKFGGAAEKSINCTVWSFSVKPQAVCGRQLGFRPYICYGDQTHTLLHWGADSRPICCCHWAYLFIVFIWYTVVMAHSPTLFVRSLRTKAL